jgi:hypothetical protein
LADTVRAVAAWIARALAIAFFLGFGGFFVFGGFQSVAVDLAKTRHGRVDATVTRRHFFGLYTVTARPIGVTAAVIETRRGSASVGTTFRAVPTSGVVLRADSGDTPLFFGTSNVDESYRRAIARKLNAFIGREGDQRLSEVFRVRNVFGWVGLPFLLIGVVGLFGWPLTALSRRRRTWP